METITENEITAKMKMMQQLIPELLKKFMNLANCIMTSKLHMILEMVTAPCSMELI
jgi:hypothetical protein